MNKNQKSVLFVGLMSIMVIFMLILYMNFLNDKPLIDAQNQQNLSPQQMINGTQKFIKDMTEPLKAPPVNLPTMNGPKLP